MDPSLWAVVWGMGALLLRAGMALHATGMVRSKNAAGILTRALADLAFATIAFWAVGAAILTAPISARSWLNWPLLFGTPGLDIAGEFFFWLTGTLISAAIVTGVTAERSRFFPMAAPPLLLAALLVPLAGRWIWGGWLERLGFRDLAAASAIHLTGALVALAAAVAVGPRAGKYNRDGSSNAIPGHSVPLASIGILIMLAAWIPYVAGFAHVRWDDLLIPLAALNILLAAAGGTLATLLFSYARYGKPDIHLTSAGLLGALVAISAAPDLHASWIALIVGLVAGFLIPIAILALDLLWKIDDPTGGIVIHGAGALWGLIAAGLFTPSPTFTDWITRVGVQFLGIAAVAALALGLSIPLMLLLNRAVGLRAREADEYDGLDLAEHDVGAYPDFQQTMIKSYHLREA